MANDFEVEIVFDPVFGSQAKRKIKDDFGRAGKESGDEFEGGFRRSTRGLGRALGGIKGQLLGIGTALAGAFAIRGFVSAVSEIERIETSLSVLLKSTGLAQEALRDLQQFAARTPFELPGIADAASGLLAVGVAQEDVIDNLQVLGDIAAGTGKNLGDLTQIFAQIRSEGRLTGERLRQLFERNIPITAALAKEFGVAEGAVRDLVRKGSVGFERFEKAFRSLTESGGLFEGALIRQSQTVGGVLSTLSDNFRLLQTELGRAFGPAIISTANQFIQIFQQFSARVVANGPVLVRTFSRLAEIFLITPAKFWSDLFAGDANKNLKEVTTEIQVLEKQMALVEERIKSTEGSTFANILGGRKQALADFGRIATRLTELKKLQSDLTGTTNEDTEAIRKNTAAQREATIAQNRALAEEQKRATIRKELGTIGLSREQIIQQQAQKDLAALQSARNQEALTEQEFNERKIERERLLNEQLTAVRSEEEQRRAQALREQQEAALNNEQTLADSLSRVSSQFKSVARDFRVTSRDIAKTLITGIGQGAGQAFAAFGRAIATGEDALKAFGQALLAAFANALIQLGTGFILQGIAQSLAGFGSGAPLIAAGAALATFGGALLAFSGGGSQGPGGALGAPGSVGTGGGGLTQDNLIGQQETEPEQARVNLTIQGDVLDSEETSLRIVQILNTAFESDGAVLTNVSTA